MKPPLARLRKKPQHSKDTDAFIHALRRKILDHCDGLKGRDVAQALFTLTDEMWHAGVDDAWVEAKVANRRRGGNIFCITWLTMLATHVEKLRARRR